MLIFFSQKKTFFFNHWNRFCVMQVVSIVIIIVTTTWGDVICDRQKMIDYNDRQNWSTIMIDNKFITFNGIHIAKSWHLITTDSLHFGIKYSIIIYLDVCGLNDIIFNPMISMTVRFCWMKAYNFLVIASILRSWDICC